MLLAVPVLAPPLALALPETIGFYIGLMLAGFMVGGVGHVVRSKVMIAAGVTMVFLATLLLPVLLNLFGEPPPAPQIQSPSGE